jgi:hypothetical protein
MTPRRYSASELVDLLSEIKALAVRYYDATGRPLGVTGEIAEYEATRILHLELAAVRQHGWDATRQSAVGVERLQIKGRRLPATRVPSLNLEREWDTALLVLLDEGFNAVAIHEAPRAAVEEALVAPGSRARNERGQLSVGKFKAIGSQVWPDV